MANHGRVGRKPKKAHYTKPSRDKRLTRRWDARVNEMIRDIAARANAGLP